MSNYLPRLATGDIKYLALEGGGGKGNAFLGALESLGHPSMNVIRNSGYRLTNIRGVAGKARASSTTRYASTARGGSTDSTGPSNVRRGRKEHLGRVDQTRG